MAYIVVQRQGREAHQVALVAPLTLGRSLKCDLWLDDPALSRLHCRFEPNGGEWMIVDLNSRNGTVVGGNNVTRRLLQDGDVVRIGHADIHFHAGATKPVRAANPELEQIGRKLNGDTVVHNSADQIGLPRPQPRVLPDSPPPAAEDPAQSTADWIVAPNSLPFTRPRPTPIPSWTND